MTNVQFKSAGGANALKLTISGSYKKAGDGEIVDFDGVEVIMPLVDEELAIAAARKRYAYSAIKAMVDKKTGEKKYPKPIDHIRQVHVDDMEEIEYEFAYVGKGIKEMDEEDFQHLAVEKGLREIPLPRRQSGLGMRELRQKAYIIFAERVLGWKIDMNDPAQNNYAKWNDIIPNPIQKAKPVQQKSIEDEFKGEEAAKDETPKHMAAEPEPTSEAPHVAKKKSKKAKEAKPEVINADEVEVEQEELSGLDALKKVADEAGIEYGWDVTESELKSMLDNAE